jgi:rhodanese-related sulfurtransferase
MRMHLFRLSILIFLFSACNAQQKTARSANADDFEKAIGAGNVQVLDVRTGGEFNGGHLKNAMWADWNNKAQFNERIQHVDKTKPVYIYCLSGGRSAAAADWMRENGFTTVVNLEGGINAWKRNNKPVEGSSSEPQMTIEQYNAAIPATGVALVDFGASWCPPCVKMEPVLQALVKEKGSAFQLIKVDGGVHTDVMKQMNVEALPVFIVYKNGKESWRKQGIVSREELLQQLNP